VARAGFGSDEGGSPGNTAPCTGCGAVSLAAPASPIAPSADVAANDTRPPFSAFSDYDSAIQARCANSCIVSSIVVVVPDVVALRASASVKSQELAADPMKQTAAASPTILNLLMSATTCKVANPIEPCMDRAPARRDSETRISLVGEIGSGVGPVLQLMFVNAEIRDETGLAWQERKPRSRRAVGELR
jgi:hypothetical protein